MKSFAFAAAAASVVSQAAAHYTFPVLTPGGTATTAWEYVRETNNYQSLNPLTDVTLPDLACYDSAEPGTADTISVAAGSTFGFNANGNPSSIYHPGVVNVYMAQAPSGTDVASWDPSGDVWFKVYEISAVTDGGSTITFPAENVPGISFTIPSELPSGQYIVRMEAIALHVAQSFGGAQFYISCANVEVTGGGSGTPTPLVSIPGVYTGYEPGILIDIYYPIPANYTQPGPAVWPAA